MAELAAVTYDFNRLDERTRTVTPDLVQAVCDRIVQAARPRLVILFGSQAGPGPAPESDIDLLVVLEDHSPLASRPQRERLGRLLDLFRYRSFALDLIVMTEAEIAALRAANEGEWDLVLEIVEQGRVLYDAALE